ncbi:hypothetical protein GJU40_09420 [Bacillus lacus]|uniref:Uncharacterized protein n=1 Tax=Metabacillus lacus TaxID=1983721 RepID=A0A7X2IZC7_9BACI|nr:hypothetical protein [Metabacillus lacus]MRX72369.1 hypothetical protein [Metabacillus lacus]
MDTGRYDSLITKAQELDGETGFTFASNDLEPLKENTSKAMDVIVHHILSTFEVSEPVEHHMKALQESVDNAENFDKLDFLIQEFQTIVVNRYY